MAEPRDAAIRRHYYQPRSLVAERAASSKPGQVYHTMTSLQDRMTRPGYTNKKADIDQLKGLRREWNREQKYTPQGMRVSDAATRMGAQDVFKRQTETFRQGNKAAYNKMYPISGGIMHLGEQGGFLGAILSEIGKMGKDKGIPTVVDDSVEDQKKYITETFGPQREDIEELDFTNEYEGPWPHERSPIDEEPLLVDEGPIGGTDVIGDITVSDLPIDPIPDPNIFIPGRGTSYVDEFADIVEEEEVPAPLSPYQGREFGLGQFMDTMPRDWQEYLEDVGRLGDMPGGHLDYEEWRDIIRRKR